MTERRHKQIDSPLIVYRTIDNAPVAIGELSFLNDDTSGFLAQFSYRQSYVDDPRATPIDPLNLPLSNATRVFNTTSRYHVLGGIFDAAPDVWGRRVINAEEGVSQINEKPCSSKAVALASVTI